MRTISTGLQTSLDADPSSLALCWRLTRNDGEMVLGTEHDVDIIIVGGELAGTYPARAGITGSTIKSGSDLSVDNMEIEGTTANDLNILNLTAADIEAGLLDDAAIVLFLTDSSEPDVGQLVLRSGNLGNITRTAEGRYKAEMRGLTQRLKQVITRTYGVRCDAELGDTRCGVSLAALTVTGSVTSVTDRRRFNSTLTAGSSALAGDYVGGLLTWTSGDNLGFSMEVKRDAVGAVLGNLELYELMPNAIQIGDDFSLTPGCDKAIQTCRDRFNNIVNFRGYGALVPGRNKVILYGKT